MRRWGCEAGLPDSRLLRARLARSIGMAKPTPALALVPVIDGSAICALIAITSPWRSISGPPEMAELIAAAVWIAPGMNLLSPSGDEIRRPLAETMPAVTVWA